MKYVIDDMGNREYDDNGQQIVQVFDGDGVPEFHLKYKQEIADTNLLFHLLEQEPKTKMLNVLVEAISNLKLTIDKGYSHERRIVTLVKGLRSYIKTLIAPHDPENDCRRCACAVENAWKIAIEWYEE